MKKGPLFLLSLAVISLLVGLAGGILIGKSRGIPFVTKGEQWTIGIYSGPSPFELSSSFWTMNPVFTAEDVTDVPAKFVADPFLLEGDSVWYLFFEVYNYATEQGDLAVATGNGGRKWSYEGVVLDEPFHLSYPYVFEWEGEYYLIPETFETQSIRLYRATDFPRGWEFVSTLVEGRDYVDPSVVYFQGRWWMFSSTTSNDTLNLFHSERLEGPWEEHPQSPIVAGDLHRSRSSGRVLVYDGRPYRFTMDVDPPAGTHAVWAFEVTTLTPTEYSERRVGENPVLAPGGSRWTEQAMHQLDAHQTGERRWIASVDGFGRYYVFGLKY